MMWQVLQKKLEMKQTRDAEINIYIYKKATQTSIKTDAFNVPFVYGDNDDDVHSAKRCSLRLARLAAD